MNADERLDATIRAALAWEADRAARRQPSFDDAVARLASRVGPEPPLSRPRLVALPGLRTARDVHPVPLLIVALLLALLAAVAVGSGLVRLPWIEDRTVPIVVPAFGFPASCEASLPDGVVLTATFGAQRRVMTLHEDGRLRNDPMDGLSITAADSGGAGVTERRLTRRGVDLLVGAVTDAGLTEGCRAHESRRQLAITARSPRGVVSASWGPYPGAYGPSFVLMRVMTPEEERVADELAQRLERPEDWLPADAWVDADPAANPPAQWVVSAGWIPSELPPGSRVGLRNGTVLDGTNPAFSDIRLPDGQTFATFECGLVTRDEADALADALASVADYQEGTWTLFSEDLSREYQVSITALVDGSPEDACGPRIDGTPAPRAPLPTGDLTALDACSLAPSDTGQEGILGVSRLRFDVESPACVYQAGQAEPSARLAEIAVYGRSVRQDEAASVVLAVMGGGSEQEAVEGGHVWMNGCWESSRHCPPAIAGWTEGRLAVIVFEQNVMSPASYVSRSDARELMRDVLTILRG